MKVKYEYKIVNGDTITDNAVMCSREEARHELREVKRAGFKDAKIVQRKYTLQTEKTVR